MAEKHVVVQGATCQCKHSVAPQTDKLKVKSQSKHYANDGEGNDKLIATTMEIGQTMEKNTFGNCKLQPTGNSYLPCQTIVAQWSGMYKKVAFENKSNPLLEDSKATCPIGGPDCITITDHGQKAQLTKQNQKNADDKVMAILYPFGDLKAEVKEVQLIPNL